MFDAVVDEYDLGRPDHPAAVYDALGDLRGRDVLDIGAGTGIATRALLARGASVVAVDSGGAVLGRAAERTPGLLAVVGDGAALPMRTGAADLVCFAQSWHWLAPASRSTEARRVLRTGGRWAAWWSHARADGEGWFDASWELIEQACPGTHRAQRDTDWGATVDSGLFHVEDRRSFAWTRVITVESWTTDVASHSYVAALPPPERLALVDAIHAVLASAFPTGEMHVRYETWLWLAHAR